MAAITLPNNATPSAMEPRLVSSRNEMSPAFGGPTQRQSRMGSKYALDYVMPPMRYDQAQEWADIDDEAATVVMRIYQPGLVIGSPGTPLVSGSGQSGSVIALKGLAAGYAIRKNQWLSISTGAQWYAYRAKSAVSADGSGNVSVPLRTMLRTSPTNNDTVAILDPKIEGYPTPADGCWSISAADRLIRLAFTITER